ncbi:MAG: hypothetical protein FD153_213 [Rhodospirillaceae bacterium]|nr:MAG: hypothetical protein FD153_213 [Rhodospirillaceae bacterium]
MTPCPGRTSVGDNDIDPAVTDTHGFESTLHCRCVGHIANRAESFDRSSLRSGGFLVHVEHRHVGAGTSESSGSGGTNPGAAARDDDDMTGQRLFGRPT